jgi:hypothetical protein
MKDCTISKYRKPGRRLIPAFAALFFLAIRPVWAAEGMAGQWTCVIPEIFPHVIYTWRLDENGRYREDGRDALSGQPVQPTLSGHWSRDGSRLVLRQDGIGYVFDGSVTAQTYAGILYLDGARVSRFCARRGAAPPERCDIPSV